MKYILETSRLLLREFTIHDSGFILELLNSEGWLQYIGDRHVKTEEQAIDYLEKGPIRSYRENGFGLWLVENKNDRTALGMCGILDRGTLGSPDIGFAFLPEFCGKGYAYEIASETLAYAKNILKIPKVAAITVPANERSIRLLTRLGLKFIKTLRLSHDKEKLNLYSN
jgi:RimJ/RimL family protein N-acetyltransferase